ncbi:MAG: hypothetical protein DMF61_27365 [Blastocatellia bacterium AA13]|nr:MAG: hypothetical protein DMF61_27365 [Blastocatellia bacterium AA13]
MEMRLQVRQTVATKLLDARLKSYPELAYYLSDFAKHLYLGTVTWSCLASMLENINNWDSKNAIFFSSQTASVCYHFRQDSNELLKQVVVTEIISKKSRLELLNVIGDFEKALRTDLGIYGVSFSNEEDDFSGKSSLYW